MEAWREQLYQNELYHHGILGQKWGVRRYQNPDGTLTEAGKRRAKDSLLTNQDYINEEKENYKKSTNEDLKNSKDFFTNRKKLAKEEKYDDEKWAKGLAGASLAYTGLGGLITGLTGNIPLGILLGGSNAVMHVLASWAMYDHIPMDIIDEKIAELHLSMIEDEENYRKGGRRSKNLSSV